MAVFAIWMAGSLVFGFFDPLPPWDTSIALWQLVFAPKHLLFMVGMAAAWLLRRYQVPKAPLCCLAGIALFMGTGIADVEWTDIAFGTSFSAIILYGLASASCIAGFVQLERNGRIKVPDFFVLMGDASYAIYITHLTFLSALAKVIHRLGWQSIASPLIIFWAMFIAAAIFGICFHLYAERPMLRYFARRIRIQKNSPIWTGRAGAGALGK